MCDCVCIVRPFSVTIGGHPSQLDFAGVVGAGLVQTNIQIPAGIHNGARL